MSFRFCYNKKNIYFEYSGIGNSLDGNEDDQFRGYKERKWDIQIDNGDLYSDDDCATSSDLDE